MILIEDTRQQRLKHNIKRDFFRSKGIILRKEALDCGDYTLINDRSVVVDTKKDIQELIGDIQVKGITLKEVSVSVHEIFEKYNLPFSKEEKIVRLIYDSDVGRDVEREILLACNDNSFCDEAERAFQRLYVKRRGFFHRGLKRAENGNVRLYVLVENRDRVHSISDLEKWDNPRLKMQKWITTPSGNKRRALKYPSAMSGQSLAKACRTMEERYGVTFLFATPEESGPMILKLLGVEV